MRYILDHDLHIHSVLSLCAMCKEQTPERILQYAIDEGYKTVCLTDHCWDDEISGGFNGGKQNIPYIKQSLPLPKHDKVNFLFGAEVDMGVGGVIGLSAAAAKELDFIIIATTHLAVWHKNLAISEEDYYSVERRASLWAERIDAVLDSDLPLHKVGIAHLACSLMSDSDENYPKILALISDETLIRIFTKAAEKGVGIELNYHDILCMQKYSDAFRIFKTAKQTGCKFYFGGDAHRPEEFTGVKEVFNWAVDSLNLTENDKFIIGEYKNGKL